MSDMSNLYKAYAAVHDEKTRENLTDQRDEISEMTLTQLTDVDLYEIAEEIVEGLFAEGRGVSESEGLVQSALAESAAEGHESDVRSDKITRLEEAFVKAFAKVNEVAPVNAVETFMKYRDSKPLVEKWYDRVNHEHGNEKIHQSLVAEDRKVVLTGLEKMISEMSEGVDAKLRAKEDRGRDLARKAEADAKKRGLKVVDEAKVDAGKTPYEKEAIRNKRNTPPGANTKFDTSVFITRKSGEHLDSARGRKRREAHAKKRGLKVTSEATYGETPGQQLAKKEKDDDAFGSPKRKKYVVTKADKKGNTKAYQNYKAGHKSYEGDSHLKDAVEFRNKLIESGKFSPEEVETILEVEGLGRSD